MTEPGLLGREVGVLARLRVDRLDLAEPEPEQVGLAGPLPGGSTDLGELVLGGAQLGVSLGEAVPQSQRPVAGEAVQGLALGRRLQQPVLVGLAVHGHQGVGERGEGGDRHGGAAGEGPRTALGRDLASQHEAAVLDARPPTPSTACSTAVRDPR